jgi:hypothetical protein
MSDTTLFEAFVACGTVLLGLVFLVCLRYCFMCVFELLFFDRYYNDPPWILKTFCPIFIQNRFHRTYGRNNRRRHQQNDDDNFDIENQLRQFQQQQQQEDQGMISLSELIVRVNHVFSDSNSKNSDKIITNDIIHHLLPGILITDESIIDLQKLVNKAKSTPSPTTTIKKYQQQQQQEDNNDPTTDVQTLQEANKEGGLLTTDNVPPPNNDILQSNDGVIDSHSNDNEHSWDDDTVHNSNGLPLCSICIHNIKKDEYVFISDTCHHMFHVDCIRGWVVKEKQQNQQPNGTNRYYKTELHINNDCPNCRTPIIQNLKLRLNTIIRKYNTTNDEDDLHHPAQVQEDRQQHQSSSNIIPVTAAITTNTTNESSTNVNTRIYDTANTGDSTLMANATATNTNVETSSATTNCTNSDCLNPDNTNINNESSITTQQ